MPANINQATASAIKVMIVDDQELLREGIASLLSLQEGIEVIGTAEDGLKAIEVALKLQPDVILMDVRMPVMDGVSATRQLREKLPGCRILMLTTFDDDEYIVEALKAGASGYLLKNIPANNLAHTIKTAHQGVYQLDPVVAAKVVAALSRSTSYAASPAAPVLPDIKNSDLTQREVEVLHLIALGFSNREIAERLVISEGTVKNHVSNILSRLGLNDRFQAALYAKQQGLGG